LENKLNEKNDVIIFIESNKKKIKKRLIKRPNYNTKLLKLFKSIQLSLPIKKKKSNFVIKNDFSSKKAKRSVKKILLKLTQ